MANQNRALQRLCIAGVGAATLIAGLPFVGVTPASAAHVGKVELFSPFTDDATGAVDGDPGFEVAGESNVTTVSIRNDGTDSTVRLLADAPAGTASVEFAYQIGMAAPVSIAVDTQRPYQADWAAAGVTPGPVTLIATARGAVNETLSQDFEDVTLDNNAATVNITSPSSTTTAQGTAGRFNDQVIARGTTSSGYAGTVEVTDILGGATGPTTRNIAVAAVEADGTWATLVDVNDAAITAETPRVAYLNASTVGGARTDETELVSLYDQVVQAPTITPGTINDVPGAPGTDVITAKVVDQFGAPVGGARVATDVNRDGIENAGDDVAFTDENGEAQLTVAAFDADGAGPLVGGTRQIDVVVNQDSIAGFNSGNGDKRTTITQNTVAPVTTSAEIQSLDETPQTTPPGSVATQFPSFPANTTSFSVDEEVPTVRVAVRDQANNPVADGTVVNYTVVFNPDEDGVDVPANNVTTNGSAASVDGFVDVPVAGNEGTYTVSAFVNLDNDAALSAGDVVAPTKTFTFDEASLEFDGGTTQAEAAGSTTRSFSYELDNGTGLAGRLVAVTVGGGDGIAVGAAGGAIFTNPQPAGNTRTADRAVLVVTDGTGSGTVSLTDPVTDADLVTAGVQQQEEEIELTATAQYSPAGAQIPIPGANNTDTVSVEFVVGASAQEIRIDDIYEIAGAATPGRPVVVTLAVDNVNNASAANTGNPVSNRAVSLTTDKGYLTTTRPGVVGLPTDLGDLAPATGPADDQLVGAYQRLAGPVSANTDDSGLVSFIVAIDRDADFDDDGRATVTVTATIDGVTRAIPVEFFTDETGAIAATTNGQPGSDDTITYNGAEPLNPAASNALEIVALDGTTVANVSSAKDDQQFFVRSRDQFGNLVGLDFDIATVGGFVDYVGGDETSFTSQTTGDIETNSTLPDTVPTGPAQTETQTVTVSSDQPTTVYNDIDPITAGFQPATGRAGITNSSTVVTDTQAISYYTPVADQFVYTFASTPGNTVTVGSAVNTVVTVKDQNGNPVEGLNVDFVRSGPGEQSATSGGFTNADGQAGYTFTSPTEGRAVVTVIVSDDNNIELSRGVQNVDFIQAAQGTSVSIDATPLVRWPGAPVITGVLRNAAGDPLPGRVVNIIYKQQSVSGLAAFRPVLRLTTDANGVYRGSIRPTVNAVWQAIYLGNNAEGASGSAYDVTKVQIANPTVNGFGTTLTVRSTRTVNFSGIVTPGNVRHPVVVQWIRPDGIFNLTAPKRTDAVGNYVTGRTFAPGTYRLRVLGVNTANNIASASRTVTLRVVQ